jgi:hypothetical protein
MAQNRPQILIGPNAESPGVDLLRSPSRSALRPLIPVLTLFTDDLIGFA